MGGIGISPYAAGQFTTFDLPAYAEQAVVGANTFALAYSAKSVTASRSELGLRGDKSFAMQDGIVRLPHRPHPAGSDPAHQPIPASQDHVAVDLGHAAYPPNAACRTALAMGAAT